MANGHPDRFIDAQNRDYSVALNEIKQGRKLSHWMWYIFPQIQGLGFTETSRHYAIKDIGEATQYLQHAVLGKRLVEISRAVLENEENNVSKISVRPMTSS